VAAYSEDFVILTCTVMIKLQSLTDEWTGKRRKSRRRSNNFFSIFILQHL